jgi:hypothetical protein
MSNRPYFIAILLACWCKTLVVAQTNKPDAAFYRTFHCTETPVHRPSQTQLATYFNSPSARQYSFENQHIRGKGLTKDTQLSRNYPVFKATSRRHKPYEAQINALIRTCLEEECLVDIQDGDHFDQFWYEIVVQNDSFFSIHLVGKICGNRCNDYSISLNYDLNTHKRLSNCAFLARLGITDKQFEKAARSRWSRLYIDDFDGKYPTFQTVSREGKAVALQESYESDRYHSGPFNELLQKASIVPVIYRHQYYLRLGFPVSGHYQDLIAFADWPLPVKPK